MCRVVVQSTCVQSDHTVAVGSLWVRMPSQVLVFLMSGLGEQLRLQAFVLEKTRITSKLLHMFCTLLRTTVHFLQSLDTLCMMNGIVLGSTLRRSTILDPHRP